jgi:hypothetical protein
MRSAAAAANQAGNSIEETVMMTLTSLKRLHRLGAVNRLVSISDCSTWRMIAVVQRSGTGQIMAADRPGSGIMSD